MQRNAGVRHRPPLREEDVLHRPVEAASTTQARARGHRAGKRPRPSSRSCCCRADPRHPNSPARSPFPYRWSSSVGRAIRNFGDPHSIAGEYAAQSLFRRTRRLGAVAILATAGILLAMNARGAWYGWMRWELSAELQAVRKVGLSIDLYAFVVVLTIGVIGWAYIGTRRMSATLCCVPGSTEALPVAICGDSRSADRIGNNRRNSHRAPPVRNGVSGDRSGSAFVYGSGNGVCRRPRHPDPQCHQAHRTRFIAIL
jgi:hypothetical protein